MILELLGAGTTAASGYLGYLVGLNRRPRALQPVCGCRHSLALHNTKTNECHDVVNVETKWHMTGEPYEWDSVQCSCQHYVGPEPPFTPSMVIEET